MSTHVTYDEWSERQHDTVEPGSKRARKPNPKYVRGDRDENNKKSSSSSSNPSTQSKRKSSDGNKSRAAKKNRGDGNKSRPAATTPPTTLLVAGTSVGSSSPMPSTSISLSRKDNPTGTKDSSPTPPTKTSLCAPATMPATSSLRAIAPAKVAAVEAEEFRFWGDVREEEWADKCIDGKVIKCTLPGCAGKGKTKGVIKSKRPFDKDHWHDHLETKTHLNARMRYFAMKASTDPAVLKVLRCKQKNVFNYFKKKPKKVAEDDEPIADNSSNLATTAVDSGADDSIRGESDCNV